jgi:hypothetical protein
MQVLPRNSLNRQLQLRGVDISTTYNMQQVNMASISGGILIGMCIHQWSTSWE